MFKFRHRSGREAGMATIWVAAAALSILLSSGPLCAQSMLEYTMQQSAAATAEKAIGPTTNINAEATQNTVNMLALPPGERADRQAGKLIREQIPGVMERVKSLFIDSSGRPIWGNIIAGLVFLLVIWRFRLPT